MYLNKQTINLSVLGAALLAGRWLPAVTASRRGNQKRARHFTLDHDSRWRPRGQ